MFDRHVLLPLLSALLVLLVLTIVVRAAKEALGESSFYMAAGRWRPR